MAKLSWWNVWLLNKSGFGSAQPCRLGDVIAYGERDALVKAEKVYGPYTLSVTKGYEVTGIDLNMYRLNEHFDDEQQLPLSHIRPEKLVGIVRRHKGYENCTAQDILYVQIYHSHITNRVCYMLHIRDKYMISIGIK